MESLEKYKVTQYLARTCKNVEVCTVVAVFASQLINLKLEEQLQKNSFLMYAWSSAL